MRVLRILAAVPAAALALVATLVVVLVTLTMAMILYGFDRVLQFVFRLVIGGN